MGNYKEIKKPLSFQSKVLAMMYNIESTNWQEAKRIKRLLEIEKLFPTQRQFGILI